MKIQDVVAEFPDIQLLVDGAVMMQLDAFRRRVATVKGLRVEVEGYLADFITEVVATTRRAYNYDNAREIYFPSVEVRADGVREFYMGPVVMEATQNLTRWKLPTSVKQKIPNATAHTCAHILEERGTKIIFTDYNTSVECPLQRNNRGWTWNLILSEVMLTYERGREIKIKYGSFLHNALWRLDNNLDLFRPALEDLQTFTTLHRLELLEPKEVSPRGKRVLEELEEIDPSDVPSLIVPFAGTLLGTQSPQTPIVKFALDYDFMKLKNSAVEILPEGKEWLIDNCLTIVNSSGCTDARKLVLVDYMPLSHLPIFLTYGDEKIRRAARRRANMLEGG